MKGSFAVHRLLHLLTCRGFSNDSDSASELGIVQYRAVHSTVLHLQSMAESERETGDRVISI